MMARCAIFRRPISRVDSESGHVEVHELDVSGGDLAFVTELIRFPGHVAVEARNEVWVGDITYLWTRQGWMYLAVIIDLFWRRVVGGTWATAAASTQAGRFAAACGATAWCRA